MVDIDGKYEKERQLLEDVGYKNVDDYLIQQLKDYYFLQGVLFDLESEYTEDEISNVLLGDREVYDDF